MKCGTRTLIFARVSAFEILHLARKHSADWKERLCHGPRAYFSSISEGVETE